MPEGDTTLLLHDADGTELEIRADDVLAVEDMSSKRDAAYRTRVIISRTDNDSQRVELLVMESAEAVAKALTDAKAAGNWGGGK